MTNDTPINLQNPVLPGFNPDPAISRKGDDFYMMTSSFQWWPGLPIYHSKDLVNWSLIDYGLKDVKLANLSRVVCSGGIWAPSLTYSEHSGLFYMVFTIAGGNGYDHECYNYVSTASSINGPWSEPVYLNARGNDSGFFHEDDGSVWMVVSDFVYKANAPAHSGTLLQQYDPEAKKLVGPIKNIFPGSGLGFVEGSKMYKHGDYYYLGVAEGGTNYGHAMTLVRSKDIWGPYEIHPENPILTAVSDDLLHLLDEHGGIKSPEAAKALSQAMPIQRAGHGDIVNIHGNLAAVVYLASRPINFHSHLGRETCIARAHWDEDGWLRLDSSTPVVELEDFELEKVPQPAIPNRDDFDSTELGLPWNSLRGPVDDLVDLNSRPGWLKLSPTPCPLYSLETVALLAQRVRHHCYEMETRIDYKPDQQQQCAGLVCYYDSHRWFFLQRTFDPELGACVAVGSKYHPLVKVAVDDVQALRLRMVCDGETIQCAFAYEGDAEWHAVGDPLDALWLSDEGQCRQGGPAEYNFTGAMIGVAAWDLTEAGPVPAFDYFNYQA
jgi:xylan 1,4-beta-xylosidase